MAKETRPKAARGAVPSGSQGDPPDTGASSAKPIQTRQPRRTPAQIRADKAREETERAAERARQDRVSALILVVRYMLYSIELVSTDQFCTTLRISAEFESAGDRDDHLPSLRSFLRGHRDKPGGTRYGRLANIIKQGLDDNYLANFAYEAPPYIQSAIAFIYDRPSETSPITIMERLVDPASVDDIVVSLCTKPRGDSLPTAGEWTVFRYSHDGDSLVCGGLSIRPPDHANNRHRLPTFSLRFMTSSRTSARQEWRAGLDDNNPRPPLRCFPEHVRSYVSSGAVIPLTSGDWVMLFGQEDDTKDPLIILTGSATKRLDHFFGVVFRRHNEHNKFFSSEAVFIRHHAGLTLEQRDEHDHFKALYCGSAQLHAEVINQLTREAGLTETAARHLTSKASSMRGKIAAEHLDEVSKILRSGIVLTK